MCPRAGVRRNHAIISTSSSGLFARAAALLPLARAAIALALLLTLPPRRPSATAWGFLRFNILGLSRSRLWKRLAAGAHIREMERDRFMNQCAHLFERITDCDAAR